MMQIFEVIEKIQETQEAIARLKTLASENPDTVGININLQSLNDRYDVLKEEFSNITSNKLIDVCSYRLISELGQRYTISSIAKSLGDFQSLFTLIYDSLKSGPKHKVSWSADAANESAFELAYTYSGSLGFALTLQNENVMFDDSNLDLAMKYVIKVAQSKDSDELSGYARELGPAPIRKIYEWASDHLESGHSVDISWSRGEEEKASMLIQTPELKELKQIIDKTSDIDEEIFTINGTLAGGDIATRIFHLVVEDGEGIRGKLDKNFKAEMEMILGDRYIARIRKQTKIFYSTEKVEVQYCLLALDKEVRLLE